MSLKKRRGLLLILGELTVPDLPRCSIRVAGREILKRANSTVQASPPENIVSISKTKSISNPKDL